MKTYSHSQLSSFEQCKKKYQYKYILREEKDFDNTVEAFMGDLVHRTLEKLYKDLQYEKENAKQDLLDHYEAMWEDEWTNEIKIVKEEYGEENYRKKGHRMIADFYESHKPFNRARTLGLETQFYYELDDERRIHVRIDRLASPEEGVYEIQDYKTSGTLPNTEKFREDRQLATYALGVYDKYEDAEDVVLVWHYLDFDKTIRIRKTKEELHALKESLLAQMRKVESSTEYPPTPSALCDYCAYQSKCPLWRHKLDEDMPSRQEIEEDVERYLALEAKKDDIEAAMNRIEKKLRAYMEKNKLQRVYDANGEHIYRWSKEVVKFPRKDDAGRQRFEEALKGLGIYKDFLKVDEWGLQRNFEDLDPMHQKILRKLGSEDVIERYYTSRK